MKHDLFLKHAADIDTHITYMVYRTCIVLLQLFIDSQRLIGIGLEAF